MEQMTMQFMLKQIVLPAMTSTVINAKFKGKKIAYATYIANIFCAIGFFLSHRTS
jgi:hypothetical protein